MNSPSIDRGVQHVPDGISDRVALGFTKLLRWTADMFFVEIDEGRSANMPAPEAAGRYWRLAEDATLREVVLMVRVDVAHHRNANHGFANALAWHPLGAAAPNPPHVALKPHWKKAA